MNKLSTQPIAKLIMDDTCKNADDAYRLAFYDVENFEIEKKICLNVEQKNCEKLRINNFNWLKEQDYQDLPDVLIIRGDRKLEPEELQFLIDLNVKICYVDETILKDEKNLKRSIREIQKTMYRSKTLKYFRMEKEVIERLENKYSNEYDNNKVIDGLIDDLLKLTKEKDELTYKHVKNVSDYVDIFVAGLDSSKKLNDFQIKKLKRAALVHDIGKLIMPNQILKKKTGLTKLESEHMKIHVNNGAFLFNNKLIREYKEAALCHHERYDGLGYPRGLRGEKIPYFARIIAVLDTYDNLMNDKNNENKSLLEVLKIINNGSGNQFDPVIVQTFLKGILNTPELREQINEEKGGIKKCS